jgi:DNA (cytosine-5)-methyltransferase 1
VSGAQIRQVIATASGTDSPSLEIDLVVGGPPCQGFSEIGKRNVEDRRNELIFEFFRLVTELQPKYFVMENVPGIASGDHRAGLLDRLVSQFWAAGYATVEPIQILNASWFGVPQDRKRLFLLGAREGLPLPSYPQQLVDPRPRRPHGKGDQSGRSMRAFGPSVWDAIGDLPDTDSLPELRIADEVELSADFERRPRSTYAKRLSGTEPDEGDLSHPRRWNPRVLTSSKSTRHSSVTVARFASTLEGHEELVSRAYRLAADGISSTIRAGTGSDRGAFTSPRPVHPRQPRVLTVREAARVHSFPDWFRFNSTKWHGFRQVGNSVPPLLARAVVSQIVAALGVSPPVGNEVWELGDPALLNMNRLRAADLFDADPAFIPRSRRARH